MRYVTVLPALVLFGSACSTDSPGGAVEGDGKNDGSNAVCTPSHDVSDPLESSTGAATGPCAGTLAGQDIVIPITPPASRISGVKTAANFSNVLGTVTVPAGCYSQIKAIYQVKSTCSEPKPAGHNWPTRCDPWDRDARLSVFVPTGDPMRPETEVLLVDGMTAFGGEQVWEEDVTDYASLLIGEHSYRLYVTSGVDPMGKGAGTDAGFDVEAKLVLTPGVPPRDVLKVVPAFYEPRYRAPAAPITAMIDVPDGTEAARIDLFTTGHDFKGPRRECDEFCKKENQVSFDGAVIGVTTPWTECCDNCTREPSAPFTCMNTTWDFRCKENPTGCPGSVILDRGGWCPGRKVMRHSFELAAAPAAGQHTLEFAIPQAEGFWAVAGAAIFYR